MKHSKISAIAIAFSTLFAGQAMAADIQNKANGYEVVTESGLLAKDVFSSNYSIESASSKTRAEVRAELAEAIENGLFDEHVSA